jgi:hypothetical protein
LLLLGLHIHVRPFPPPFLIFLLRQPVFLDLAPMPCA